MPLTDLQRLDHARRRPWIVDLWLALQPLRSVTGFMQTGAHPDDETTEMLAALTFRDGLNLAYACANRGEGGQNDIGTEVTEDLGVLRTAEMERAADVLAMRLYWLSESPEDSIFDFGFSKSGVETLGKWGRERTLVRFVHILRVERPDAICPTFLDIPGQHGHHRAMTELAFDALEAAADPGFASDLPVWSVSKLYLPAWSGAGGSYDDEVPPPKASFTVPGKGADPVTGWSWANIGQMSRAFHLTQGMGRWVAPEGQRDWPLHSAVNRTGVADTAITAGLPQTVADLDLPGDLGARIDTALTECVAAFPVAEEVLRAATEATVLLRQAQADLPRTALDLHGHRLTRKQDQLARVIRLAAHCDVSGDVAQPWLAPGQSAALTLSVQGTDVSAEIALPQGWVQADGGIGPGPEAAPGDPYPATYDPLNPPRPHIAATVTAHGVATVSRLALDTVPVVLPAVIGAVTPDRMVLNRAVGQRRVTARLTAQSPGTATLTPPPDWRGTALDRDMVLDAPEDAADGLYHADLTIDDAPAASVRRIAYPHIAPRARAEPARLALRVLSAEVPQARIGYIGAGTDRVDHWLTAMGAQVEALTDADLDDRAALDRFDSLVIGIFAMRFRPALLAAMGRINDWVRAGGNLVTLYHRPRDNWDPATVPPARLEIGQPSLRWRVTDEAAEVTHLVPDHPLLTTPNRIGPDDWAGWHKERGLYFGKSWDPAYTPLLSMADPDEPPHHGALLTAEIGAGRHTHCALILHHQMEKLVPGAFRLMANLITPLRR